MLELLSNEAKGDIIKMLIEGKISTSFNTLYMLGKDYKP
jgi:hypothetical protein